MKHLGAKDVLELNIDVLIPAALENQITEENAENITANYILELAN
jgi:glutamate dehydrogenase (NADP+)